jgi:hypothetical protein
MAEVTSLLTEDQDDNALDEDDDLVMVRFVTYLAGKFGTRVKGEGSATSMVSK